MTNYCLDLVWRGKLAVQARLIVIIAWRLQGRILVLVENDEMNATIYHECAPNKCSCIAAHVTSAPV